VLVACADAGAEVEELVATVLADGELTGAGLVPVTPPSSAAPDEAPSEERHRRPTDRDVSGYLAEVGGDATERDHLHLDLGVGEVPALAVVARTGRDLHLHVAVWNGARYATAGALSATDVDRLGLPVVTAAEGNGLLVLLPHSAAGAPMVAVARVAVDGTVSAPPSCPLRTSLRQVLRFRAGHAETVQLGCAAGDLVWRAGAFVPDGR